MVVCRKIYLSALYILVQLTNTLKNVFETWEILEEEITKFKDIYNICLSGDFNARTGLLHDFILNDENKYLDLPFCYNVDEEFIPRNNCDKKINVFGNKLIQLCKMCGIRIMNGRSLGDSIGKMTCHEHNGSSAVDYFLADSTIIPRITTLEVLDQLNEFSDHCPIAITINVNIDILAKNNKRTIQNILN